MALCAAAALAVTGLVAAPAGQAQPEPTLDEVQDQVDDLYQKLEEATERYNAATDELAAIKRRVERAKSAVGKREAAVDAARAQMAGFAAASYRMGGFDPALQTFLAERPADFLAQAAVVDAYARQQAGRVSAAADVRRQFEQAKLLADEELARQRAVEAGMAAEQKTIEDLLAKAETLREELGGADDAGDREDADLPSRDDGDQAELSEVPPSEKARIAVEFALAQVGKSYCWGGTGPDCFDCSGLTWAAWAEAGVNLPRSSGDQINGGTRVSMSELQPGDLVYYFNPIRHASMYIGDGMIVHSTNPSNPIKIDPVDQMPFAGATRPG